MVLCACKAVFCLQKGNRASRDLVRHQKGVAARGTPELGSEPALGESVFRSAWRQFFPVAKPYGYSLP